MRRERAATPMRRIAAAAAASERGGRCARRGRGAHGGVCARCARVRARTRGVKADMFQAFAPRVRASCVRVRVRVRDVRAPAHALQHTAATPKLGTRCAQQQRPASVWRAQRPRCKAGTRRSARPAAKSVCAMTRHH
jgi:hypothetical protein